jgi:hypothetical protein
MIPEASRFSLGVRGFYSEVTFVETENLPEFNNHLARLELRGAMNLSRRWQANGYVGEEDNDFLSASDEIDGEYWDVGLRYTPNERVTIDAGYGERFFGEAPRFAIDYRHKRTNLRTEYLRDVQFARDIRGTGNFNPGDPLDPGLGTPGGPLPGTGSPTFLGQGPVLNERFVLTYRFEARRTTLALQISDSRQVLLRDNAEGTFRSATAMAYRRLRQAATLDLGITYTENEGNLGFVGGIGDEPGQGLEAWRANVGLRRQLGDNVELTLRYDYLDQGGTGDFAGIGGNLNAFEEHLISLSLQFNFGAGAGGGVAAGGAVR